MKKKEGKAKNPPFPMKGKPGKDGKPEMGKPDGGKDQSVAKADAMKKMKKKGKRPRNMGRS